MSEYIEYTVCIYSGVADELLRERVKSHWGRSRSTFNVQGARMPVAHQLDFSEWG